MSTTGAKAGIRLVPALDRDPRLVAFVATPMGKAVVLGLFAALLFALGHLYWWQVSLILAVMTYVPEKRQVWLLFASAIFWTTGMAFRKDSFLPALYEQTGAVDVVGHQGVHSLGLVAALGVLAGSAWLLRDGPWARRFRYPVATWGVFLFLLMAAASYLPLSDGVRVWAWVLIALLAAFFWFHAYTLNERGVAGLPPTALQLGRYLPFWSAAHVPFLKGSNFMQSIEAKTPEDLARSQLKGIKLAWWALILVGAQAALEGFLFGEGRMSLLDLRFLHDEGWLAAQAGGWSVTLLPIPFQGTVAPYWATLDACIQTGLCLSPAENWASLIGRFVSDFIGFAIWGHGIIAICRMAGWCALRNMYKPLQAQTIAEFWNRFDFYFKELLLNLFFYPIFLNARRLGPEMRKFLGILAAAGFGNAAFHLTYKVDEIMARGLFEAIWDFQVYIAYTLLLSVSIYISQRRMSRRGVTEAPGALRRWVFNPLFVLGFYCALNVLSDTRLKWSLADYTVYLKALVGFGGGA